MKKAFMSAVVFFIVCSVSFLAFSQPDPFGEALEVALKKQSIIVSNEKLTLIKSSARIAVDSRCEGASSSASKLRFAAVDIAEQLGLNAKIDSSVVPRIESALTSMECRRVKT